MKKNNLKKIPLSVAIFTALISSLALFARPGITQEYAGCFMIKLSGEVVDLNNICINEKTVCQGLFDSNGFPLILSAQLEQLQAAITKAEQTDSDNSDMDAEVIGQD